MQSGVAVSPTSFWDGDRARHVAHKLAEKVNCSTHTSEKLKDCLQGKEARELVTAAEKLFVSESI